MGVLCPQDLHPGLDLDGAGGGRSAEGAQLHRVLAEGRHQAHPVDLGEHVDTRHTVVLSNRDGKAG